MKYLKWHLACVTVIFGLLIFPIITFARTTPQDLVNAQKEAYQKTVRSYSLSNQQKLTQLGQRIAQVNQARTDELDQIMTAQAVILDEYERRSGGKDKEGIKEARYWITYAHEAVAYQAAKIYVLDLHGEARMKSDALSTISLFQSELNSTRSKVIKSQKILKGVVSKNED